jgi:hypothetical protein
MDDLTAQPITTADLIKELEATVTEAGLCLSYWRVFNDPDHVEKRSGLSHRQSPAL